MQLHQLKTSYEDATIPLIQYHTQHRLAFYRLFHLEDVVTLKETYRNPIAAALCTMKIP